MFFIEQTKENDYHEEREVGAEINQNDESEELHGATTATDSEDEEDSRTRQPNSESDAMTSPRQIEDTEDELPPQPLLNRTQSRTRQPDSESDPMISSHQAEEVLSDPDQYDDRSFERPAKLRFNPSTKEVKIYANLGSEVQEGSSASGESRAVSRQNSTARPQQPNDTIGGTNVSYNFQGCNISGCSFGAENVTSSIS